LRRANAYCLNDYLLSLTVQAFSISFTIQHIHFSTFRLWIASLALTAKYLLCPLLTSVQRSTWIAPPSVSISKDTVQISQGKTRIFQCVNAGFIKHTPLQMEDFVVTCPSFDLEALDRLVPDVPHLRSGFRRRADRSALWRDKPVRLGKLSYVLLRVKPVLSILLPFG